MLILSDQINQGIRATIFQIQDLYWQALRKLCVSNTERVCKIGAKQAMCDAMNLGCLFQQIPDLQDPRNLLQFGGVTASGAAKFADSIPDGCASILFKFGDHKSCGIGKHLSAEEGKVIDAVQGLDLGA